MHRLLPPGCHFRGKMKAVIIGAGLGGLLAGAKLAGAGYIVEIYEKLPKYELILMIDIIEHINKKIDQETNTIWGNKTAPRKYR